MAKALRLLRNPRGCVEDSRLRTDFECFERLFCGSIVEVKAMFAKEYAQVDKLLQVCIRFSV